MIRDNDGSLVVAYAAAIASIFILFYELQSILKGLQVASEICMEHIMIATNYTMYYCVCGTNIANKKEEKTILDQKQLCLRSQNMIKQARI